MELNGIGPELAEQATRILEDRVKHKIDKIEAVPGRVNVVKCNCTVPRGYWFGMPLLIQRDPRIIHLDKLLITAERLKIRHGICSTCNTLYFTVQDINLKDIKEDHADTGTICVQHPSGIKAAS